MQQRKIFLAAACICAAALLFIACSGKEEAESGDTELTVFAAASLTEVLTELGDIYMAEHNDVKLQFQFGSSGTLLTQITEGADCDIFLSAAQQQMDALSERIADDRFDLLENKVVLAVPEGNPAGIHSYEDLQSALSAGEVLFAMGNREVPVGQYTQQILSYLKLEEAALAEAGVITYGSNVKEVTTQISEGLVDCGMVYATDAYAAGLKVVAEADASMCGQVIYPAARLNTSKQLEAADAFLAFLQGKKAAKVFADYGFSPISVR